jgi:Transcription factor WhiB
MKKPNVNREDLPKQSIYDLLVLPDWFKDASCKGVDPSIMDGETLADIQIAKAICADCPIAALCADRAIKMESAGVWGGLTPDERKAMRSDRPLIDLVEIGELARHEANLFSGKTVKVLAGEYEVAERTIYRWRKDINEFKKYA